VPLGGVSETASETRARRERERGEAAPRLKLAPPGYLSSSFPLGKQH
jgi:hypothetical protein